MSESEYDETPSEQAGDPLPDQTAPRWSAPERSSRLLRATLIVSLVYLAILLAVFLALRSHGVFA